MRSRVTAFTLLLVLLTLASGCNWVSAIAYYFGPRRIEKARHTLPPARVAVLIDTRAPLEVNPVLNQAIYDTLVETLREKKVAARFVPYDDVLLLQQRHEKYPGWSIQKIGRRLDAEEVIHIQIEELRFRAAAQDPLLEPHAIVKVKVIGTHSPRPRLWPEEGVQRVDEGRIEYDRPPVEVAGPEVLDAEATKLGKDLGRRIAMYFYDVDLEEDVLPEP